MEKEVNISAQHLTRFANLGDVRCNAWPNTKGKCALSQTAGLKNGGAAQTHAHKHAMWNIKSRCTSRVDSKINKKNEKGHRNEQRKENKTGCRETAETDRNGGGPRIEGNIL